MIMLVMHGEAWNGHSTTPLFQIWHVLEVRSRVCRTYYYIQSSSNTYTGSSSMRDIGVFRRRPCVIVRGQAAFFSPEAKWLHILPRSEIDIFVNRTPPVIEVHRAG